MVTSASRGRRRAVVAATAGLAAVMAGCSALLDLSPLDFVESAPEAGAEAEAAIPVPDAARDAPSGLDGAVVPPPSKGCALVDAELCDDFDHGEALSVRWTSKSIEGDASLDPSSERARSAPASLRGTNASPAAFLALLQRDFPKYTSRIVIAFDVLFAVAPSGGTFILQGNLTPTLGNNNDAINPMIAAFPDDGGISITAFNWKPFSGNLGVHLAQVPVGTWVHLEASLERDALDAGSTNARFSADGVPLTRAVASEDAVATPGIALGPQSGGAVVDVFYDNVVIDTR